MNETMQRIQKISNERTQLWCKAGNGGLSREEQRRVREIADRLPLLWDQYRRELAGDTRVLDSTYLLDDSA